MFQIDKAGRIKVGDRYRGTVNVPGKIHPEARELVDRWKELRALCDEVDKDLFQVTAGDDYDEVSARVLFSVPSDSWNTADQLDDDLRKVWSDLIDLVDLGIYGTISADSVQLDTELSMQDTRPSTWTLTILGVRDQGIILLRPLLQFVSDAVRSSRLEEFATLP